MNLEEQLSLWFKPVDVIIQGPLRDMGNPPFIRQISWAELLALITQREKEARQVALLSVAFDFTGEPEHKVIKRYVKERLEALEPKATPKPPAPQTKWLKCSDGCHNTLFDGRETPDAGCRCGGCVEVPAPKKEEKKDG